MRGRRRRDEEAKRYKAEQERRREQEEREKRIRQTQEAVKKLFEEIQELAGEPGSRRCVYEGGVRRAVLEGGRRDKGDDKSLPENEKSGKRAGSGILPSIWARYCEAEEFDGYVLHFWMEQVFPQAVFNHYVILGSCSGIYELLEKNARQIKSLRWLLLEAEYDEELEDFAENFYIEYGIVIELQTFQSEAAFRRLRLVCSQPANIIDFTGDVYFHTAEVAEGSIWLDMLAREEKRYRIAGRPGGIRYFSLKEEWKHARRCCEAPEKIPETITAAGERAGFMKLYETL